MNDLINMKLELTMSSLEIATLVEKRHDNVKRTIETLADNGVIVRPQIEDEQKTDSLGRLRSEKVFMFEGERGKRDSIIVVAQLSPELTGKEHDNVRRDISKMAHDLSLTFEGKVMPSNN
uniref:KilAC domain protein n=1 Tax=Klebsiella phage KpTDp1 TaxID=3161143 RepID=A0AAU7YR76_9CAUD